MRLVDVSQAIENGDGPEKQPRPLPLLILLPLHEYSEILPNALFARFLVILLLLLFHEGVEIFHFRLEYDSAHGLHDDPAIDPLAHLPDLARLVQLLLFDLLYDLMPYDEEDLPLVVLCFKFTPFALHGCLRL